MAVVAGGQRGLRCGRNEAHLQWLPSAEWMAMSEAGLVLGWSLFLPALFSNPRIAPMLLRFLCKLVHGCGVVKEASVYVRDLMAIFFTNAFLRGGSLCTQ